MVSAASSACTALSGENIQTYLSDAERLVTRVRQCGFGARRRQGWISVGESCLFRADRGEFRLPNCCNFHVVLKSLPWAARPIWAARRRMAVSQTTPFRRMYANEYSQRALDVLIQSDEVSTFPVLLKRHNRDDYVRRIAASVADRTFRFASFERLRVGKFQAYEPNKLGDRLVIRRLNNVLRRTYRIKQSDRNDVVRQSVKLLTEPAEKYIVKLDIKGFYESIDRTKLLGQLDDDQLLSDRTRWLLREVFKNLIAQVPTGLPRGISVSATLSEILMRRIDQKIRQIDGVYFAARYVDDLIIFSTSRPAGIVEKVQALLPVGMALNEDKTKSVFVGCCCSHECVHIATACPCVPKCTCVPDPLKRRELSYLGYRISFNNIPSSPEKKKRMKVDVGLSKSKVNRYKTRIVLAFLSHIKSPNFELLRQRIRFLCENSQFSGPGLRGRLKTGVRFNYPLINDYAELVELDHFLRAQIFSSIGAYGMRMTASLSTGQKAVLAAYSFRSGHQSHRSRPVHSTEFDEIRACWKHA
ncbi:antiviral reverse transcriptase Drt3a [Paraburkholderia sp. SIMBA_053]|uniref:antiviral reverse transcriptase Drt3a n=1 Tax=Paraburkholderia sp. SIMBA_053 TaxID=3085794 RepID=UPI00397E4ABC